MPSNTIGPLSWPPNTYCISNSDLDPQCLHFQPIVTPDMVSFLNLTSLDIYKQVYCLSPPDDDSCSFGYCPNLDVAGR